MDECIASERLCIKVTLAIMFQETAVVEETPELDE